MNHLLGASIAAGRVVVGVAAGIKCRPYLDSPLMRMVKLFTARSYVSCNVGKNMKMDNAGHRQKEKKFSQFFTNVGNAQKNTGYHTGYHEQIQSDDEQIQSDDEQIGYNEEDFFDDDEVESDDEVKTQAVDYLGTLDWESLQNHIIYFPRKRSEDEVRLVFEKWAAHYDRKYPSAESKEMRFAIFKKRLAIIDEGNLKGEFTLVLKADSDIEG